MTTSKFAVVNGAIKTALETITVANGFVNNIVLVNLAFADPKKIEADQTKFPYINYGVLEWESEVLDANYTQFDLKCTREFGLYIHKGDGSIDPDDLVMDFYGDFSKALQADPFLSGNLIDSDIPGGIIAENLPNLKYISCYVKFHFRFMHSVGDPTT